MHNQISGPQSDIPRQHGPPYFGFTPAHARLLNHKRNTPYKIITDRDDVDWLVDFVCDTGRFMHLIRAGTEGQFRKVLTSRNYLNYTITLGPEDM